MAEFRVSFLNDTTRRAFEDPSRNICLSGGYGSAKTTTALMKYILLALAFRGYRTVIGRQVFKDLKQTTLMTFKKICPNEFLAKWDMNEGLIEFKNGSQFLCMHLDTFDEKSIKGLEVNSIYLDQPEELSEQVYTTLDPRIDRWDRAEPDEYFVSKYNLKLTRNSYGKWNIPCSMMLTPNPDTETHWIYRYFHPDSFERRPNHAYYEVSSTENPALSQATLQQMMSRDPAWVNRFVHGKWGINEANIHRITPTSRIKPNKELLANWIKKATLFRVLDHGDASPTCCLWFLSFNKYYVCYREYYSPGKLISEHRRRISELSYFKDLKGNREEEPYVANWADPSIFKATHQKYGGFWTTAQEYLDPQIDAPQLPWSPADNNELTTRNRINELLAFDEAISHPITGEACAPKLYFIEKDLEEYGTGIGCEQVILQTNAQKRVKLSEINGKPIFSDDRDDSIDDHAYDPLRYFVAMHALGPRQQQRKPSETSFLAAQRRLAALRKYSETADMFRA